MATAGRSSDETVDRAERSKAGRIRYEYFAITFGLNPEWAIEFDSPLLLRNLKVSEMGLDVAVGPYVIPQLASLARRPFSVSRPRNNS